jgi:multiple sugar transport system substrate-binding protein
MRGEEEANMSSRKNRKGWTRRDVLGALGRTAALGVLGTGVGPAVLRAGAATRDFNWRKHAGTSLRFCGWNELWSMAMDKKVAEFEQVTGIKLNWEHLPQDQNRQKVQTELTAKNKDLDLLWVAPHVEGVKYLRAGWLVPLDEFLGKPDLVPPDFDLQDFAPGFWNTCRMDGKMTTFPTVVEVACLMYRSDLLEKKGLKAPTTLEELEAAVAKLHDPPNVYGIVNRGTITQAPVTWSSYLYNFGGDYLDKNRQCAIHTPEAVRATDYYGRLHRQYGPPGITTLNWPESSSVIAQGKAAFTSDNNNWRNIYDDPEKSKVVGKMAYALFPRGPAGNTPGIWTAGPSISAYSEKKEAAWYFIIWSLSKANQLYTHLSGIAATRRSAWQSPRYKEQEKNPAWAEVTLKTMEMSSKGYSPEVVSVMEVRNRVGEVIVKALQGVTGDALRAEAAKACADITRILERTEKA